MKKYKIFLIIGSVFGLGMINCFANAEYIHIHPRWVNPVYRNIPMDHASKPLQTLREDTPVTVTSYAEFKNALLDKYRNRVRYAAFNVRGINFNDAKEFPNRFDIDFDKETEAEDPYTYYNFSLHGNVSINGYDGNVTISYPEIRYLTDFEQEQYVSQRVSQILGEIITSVMNDEQKLKAIHDWVVRNVKYDTVTPGSYLLKYSAYNALYAGLAVCQGYALLTFRMLKDSGLSARIVSGKAWDSQQNQWVDHAWNLVRLCGSWYHTDVTWDDPIPDDPSRILYTYYNRTDSELESMQDHTWIKANYPTVSSVSYMEGLCSLTLADVIEGLRILTGIPPLAALRLIDINGDGKIGPEEIIHALQKIASLR